MSDSDDSDPDIVAPARAVSPAMRGSFRLFRLLGTDVYIHWSFFLVAIFLVSSRPVIYSSWAWDALLYLLAFGLVMLHEFGHVIACRLMGGAADEIVLWPLGGLAYVAPPPRPAAILWTTAAGPLVNLVLTPFLVGAAALAMMLTPGEPMSDVTRMLAVLAIFNVAMLVFNLLPIYPMDGGRILQAILWWPLGRATALRVAAIVGMIGGAGLGLLALIVDWWLVVIAAFLMLGAYGGLAYARMLERMEHAERRPNLACPNCGAAAPVGEFWRCTQCFTFFDLFDPTPCPRAGIHIADGACPNCGYQLTMDDWVVIGVEPDESE